MGQSFGPIRSIAPKPISFTTLQSSSREIKLYVHWQTEWLILFFNTVFFGAFEFVVLEHVAAIVGKEAATRPLAASCLINFLRWICDMIKVLVNLILYLSIQVLKFCNGIERYPLRMMFPVISFLGKINSGKHYQ